MHMEDLVKGRAEAKRKRYETENQYMKKLRKGGLMHVNIMKGRVNANDDEREYWCMRRSL